MSGRPKLWVLLDAHIRPREPTIRLVRGRPDRVDMDTKNGYAHVHASMSRPVDAPILTHPYPRKIFRRNIFEKNFLHSNA